MSTFPKNCWQEKDYVPVGLSTRFAGADKRRIETCSPDALELRGRLSGGRSVFTGPADRNHYNCNHVSSNHCNCNHYNCNHYNCNHCNHYNCNRALFRESSNAQSILALVLKNKVWSQLGWHYLSNASCLTWPHSFSTALLV